jgi:hypothetical protein
MKHKTLWLVIFWIAFLAVALVAQALIPTALPLAPVINLAGVVSLAYVGIDKTKNIVAAAKAPAGDYGLDYVPPMQDKHLWIVIVWLVLLILTLAIAAYLAAVKRTEALPLTEAVMYAGILSAAYIGLDKGAKVAAAAGEQADAPKEGTVQ